MHVQSRDMKNVENLQDPGYRQKEDEESRDGSRYKIVHHKTNGIAVTRQPHRHPVFGSLVKPDFSSEVA